MKDKVLLISENYLKSNFVLDDNLSPKYIQSAIRQAQREELKQVLGKKLYDTICSMVADGTIQLSKNEVYKDILDEAQGLLGYATISRIIMMASSKVSNMGVVRTKDENTENVDLEELITLKDYFQNQSDFAKNELQEFLRDIKGELPTGMFKCSDSELDSAYTGGIWTGGYRSRILN